jgi:hypothetical protein
MDGEFGLSRVWGRGGDEIMEFLFYSLLWFLSGLKTEKQGEKLSSNVKATELRNIPFVMSPCIKVKVVLVLN